MDTSVYLDNSKEATSLYAQLEEAQVEIARLRAALTEACWAIDSLPADALGMANDGNRYQWPVRDELLAKMRSVLAGNVVAISAAEQRAELQAEVARLREVLRHLVYECENGCNLTIFDVIDKKATPLLAESHPVTGSVTEQKEA